MRRLFAADLVALAPSADAAPVAAIETEFFERHARPVRRYHTVEHARFVRDDVVRWAPVAGLDAETTGLVRLAAWYHDVVYDGRPGDDERASADLLAVTLAALGREDLMAAGRMLVLATIDHAPPDAAAAVLTDADLGVLAGAPDSYARYVADVRAEYAHVDDEAWRRGRSTVLRSLLSRPALFHGPAAAEREGPARRNLEAELAALA